MKRVILGPTKHSKRRQIRAIRKMRIDKVKNVLETQVELSENNKTSVCIHGAVILFKLK